jgi:hypothetical protein
MKRNTLIIAVISVFMLLTANNLFARGNNPGPVVFVTSQGLYYDAIVAAKSLPMKGPFQQLLPGGGPQGGDFRTEFGPGQPGHKGGRWWLDNGNGVMGEEDSFFSCPLLGPGREFP